MWGIMEKTKTKLAERLEYIKQFGDDQASADYNIYFLDRFVPIIVNYFLRTVRLEKIHNINDASDIKIKFKVHISKSKTYSGETPEPTMDFDSYSLDEELWIHIPEDTYDKVKLLIERFFCSMEGTEKITRNTDNTHYLMVNTTLEKLLETYGRELPVTFANPYNRYARTYPKTAAVSNRIDSTINGLESVFADRVHKELFEEEFLDGYIQKIIDSNINNLTNRNISKIEKGEHKHTLKSSVEIAIGKGSTSRTIFIDNEEEQDAFTEMVRRFIYFYNIGEIIYYHGNEGYTIKITGSIEDLMYAYAMEKQRIQHALTVEAYQFKNK